MRHHLRIVALLLVAVNAAYSQQNAPSYFVAAGKGASAGEWELRYIVTGGVEVPLKMGFSIRASLDYLEFPFYNYGGLDRLISHETKSDVSLAAVIKVVPQWRIAPFLAAGGGLASINEGRVVRETSLGSRFELEPKSGLASYVCFQTGVETPLTDHFIISFGLRAAHGLGSDLYSDSFGGQLGIRFSP